MKNFKLILMVALVLMFSSHKVFADDPFGVGKLAGDISSGLGSISNQIGSGINGLANHQYGAVAQGFQNFAVSTPVLSQVYGMGQMFGSGISGLGNAYSTNGLSGVGNFAAGAAVSGVNGLYGMSGLSKISIPNINTGIGSNLAASAESSQKIIPGAGSALPYKSPQVIAQNTYIEKRSNIISHTSDPIKIYK
jgi:hypothetical protein